MHFITFPVATTNIFPLANSAHGGQLATEYNLKSRETVMTNPDVKYVIGPSFIHSEDDFRVKLLEDPDVDVYDATKTYTKGDYCSYNNNTYVCIVDIPTAEAFNSTHWTKSSISSSILQIDPGRAVINGHFVETLAPMQLDLNLANIELKQASKPELFGNLSIGLKTYFSTESTMAGAMLVENTEDMYVGVQLVVDQADNFKVPGDEGCRAENERDNITADIKLADFTFIHGAVSASSILQNADATRFIDSRRIADFSSVLSDQYVTSEGLVDNLFYTFSGKSKDWCNSTGSLMVWDRNPEMNLALRTKASIQEIEAQYGREANFYTDPMTGRVSLVVPHKQPDESIDSLNPGDKTKYYSPKIIDFPTASYSDSTSGIVTAEYTNKIKEIASYINTYKQFTNGKQISFVDILTIDEDGKYDPAFPTDFADYNAGDYVLVRADYTVDDSEDEGLAVSTMYIVLPGGIVAINEVPTTTKPTGMRLGAVVPLYEKEGAVEPVEGNPDSETLLELFNYDTLRGSVGDFFEIAYYDENDTKTSYYYAVTNVGQKSWSKPIVLTGGISLATDTQIGGFYNASLDSAYIDAGYVYLDDTGHLRLRDYELVRSGALAYQLGADFSIPTNSTLEAIQGYLDDYVNARVAFFTNATLTTVTPTINITIPLPAGEAGVLNIYNIDSRFGTAVNLDFVVDTDPTKDYSNIVINISDCQKIKIDNAITTVTKKPIINLFRSCLYYDAEIINYIRSCTTPANRAILFPDYAEFTGFDGLTLWYAQLSASDPALSVNGMEVLLSKVDVESGAQEITFWDTNIPSDNHYKYALRSITLSNVGKIIGCSLYVTNITTADIDATKRVIIGGDFVLPQGANLNYPKACLNNPLHITGTFTTAYPNRSHTKWITTETSFTATSGVYDGSTGIADGKIAFNSLTESVDATYTGNVTEIDGWAPGAYHIFYGGTTVDANS
jgi:hypothetical protein